jgi:hypothetical protein
MAGAMASGQLPAQAGGQVDVTLRGENLQRVRGVVVLAGAFPTGRVSATLGPVSGPTRHVALRTMKDLKPGTPCRLQLLAPWQPALVPASMLTLRAAQTGPVR